MDMSKSQHTIALLRCWLYAEHWITMPFCAVVCLLLVLLCPKDGATGGLL